MNTKTIFTFKLLYTTFPLIRDLVFARITAHDNGNIFHLFVYVLKTIRFLAPIAVSPAIFMAGIKRIVSFLKSVFFKQNYHFFETNKLYLCPIIKINL
jgi:hypothetical protein